ncbi:MAG: hypothetical protein R3301_18525, partial [Saprospiraceae bacterium]|nr:hypothetical protein [Saprospiraceae bacterium]
RNKIERQIRALDPHAYDPVWEYIMHVLNLATLARLPEQDEQSMHFEQRLMTQVTLVEKLDAPARTRVMHLLGVESDHDLFARPLAFAEDCSLIADLVTGVDYLTKDRTLTYELDPEIPQWKQFLLAVDGRSSAFEICGHHNIPLDVIEEFILTSIDEEILVFPQIEVNATT